MTRTPPQSYPEKISVSEFEGNWYVAHTKSRFEKALACDLIDLGIAYFLPMREKKYVSGGKKRVAMLPIFTSYLFLCSPDTEAKATVFRTGRIASIIDVVDRDRFVRELCAIEKALENDLSLTLTERLTSGQSCRVISGAMMGTEGRILQVLEGKSRVVLEISALGKGVEMEIDSTMLEKI